MKKQNECVLIVIIFLLTLVFDPTIRNAFTLPKLIVLRTGTIALVWLWFRNWSFRLDDIILTAFGFMGWIIVSTFYSIHFQTALYGSYGGYGGAFTLINYALLTVFVAQMPLDREMVLKGFILTMMCVSIYAIIQGFGFYAFKLPEWGRVYSTIGNPVPMGAVVALAIPFAVYFIRQSVLWVVPIPILFYAVYLSKSIGVYAGLIASGLVLIILTGKKKVFILLVLLALVLGVGNHKRIQSVFQESTQIRLVYWKAALKMIKDRPVVGVGPANMRNAYPQYRERVDNVAGYVDRIPRNAHNGYLDMAAKTGIVGLFLYLLLIFSVVKKLLNRWTPIDSLVKIKKLPLINICFLASIGGFLVQDLTGWINLGLTPFFFIILGLGGRK